MNTVDRIKEMTGIDILTGDDHTLEGEETVVDVRADFPILIDGTRFAMSVKVSVPRPSDDYSERMMALAIAMQKIVDEIEEKHGS
jgi:hypothetical protein